ncbi:immunoglobulin E-set [Stachybotrys elegans]|uniref:Immunoglobulin E-set n=1 Tax=Stachybotrys elegans TaxID=80388 RepID=A0A8K0SRS3_9HYPO|nr:immunoglobulin E-set [Stachybotrys elegans]
MSEFNEDLVLQGTETEETAPGKFFTLSIQFKIENDLISGLTLKRRVELKGMAVGRRTDAIGSHVAGGPYTASFGEEEAPSGALARERYIHKAKIQDDDGNVHSEFDFVLDVKEEW